MIKLSLPYNIDSKNDIEKIVSTFIENNNGDNTYNYDHKCKINMISKVNSLLKKHKIIVLDKNSLDILDEIFYEFYINRETNEKDDFKVYNSQRERHRTFIKIIENTFDYIFIKVKYSLRIVDNIPVKIRNLYIKKMI